jgi:hypothetical protein
MAFLLLAAYRQLQRQEGAIHRCRRRSKCLHPAPESRLPITPGIRIVARLEPVGSYIHSPTYRYLLLLRRSISSTSVSTYPFLFSIDFCSFHRPRVWTSSVCAQIRHQDRTVTWNSTSTIHLLKLNGTSSHCFHVSSLQDQAPYHARSLPTPLITWVTLV